jgi:hypothetical protein
MREAKQPVQNTHLDILIKTGNYVSEFLDGVIREFEEAGTLVEGRVYRFEAVFSRSFGGPFVRGTTGGADQHPPIYAGEL